MIVAVGSRNKAKLKAVEIAFKRFGKEVEVKAIDAESSVSKQPLSLQETVRGAAERAKMAWKQSNGKCDYSVGIEAGLFPVPETQSGYMDTGAVAVFDGKRIYLGLTPCFEYPKEVVEKILREGKEISDVFVENWGENTRDEQGAIGRLSLGNIPRSKLHEAGLVVALMQLFNKKYYR